MAARPLHPQVYAPPDGRSTLSAKIAPDIEPDAPTCLEFVTPMIAAHKPPHQPLHKYKSANSI